MAGTAIAGPDATRAITKSKVKNIAKKQANKAIDQQESSLNVNSAKTADNATTAANATNANAVDGQSVTKVFARVANGSADVVVATVGPLTIEADCTGNNIENLEVRSSAADVAMVAQGNGEGGGTPGPSTDEDNGGTPPRILSLNQDPGTTDNDRGNATFNVARADGTVWSGNIGFDDPNIFNGESTCAVFGQIVSSG